MLKKLMIVAALSAAAATVYAADAANVKQTHPLKDGSTLYVFKDGKMGMEDKNGRVMRMKAGVVMEAKDGQKFIMIGNEVARVEILGKEHQGGN